MAVSPMAGPMMAMQQPPAQAAAAKGPGKGKIPPGLAKKDPYSLPDGNPWKQILLQTQQQAMQQPGQQAASSGAKGQPSPMQLAQALQILQQVVNQQGMQQAKAGPAPAPTQLPPGGIKA